MKKLAMGLGAALILAGCDLGDQAEKTAKDLVLVGVNIGLNLKCGNAYEGTVTESEEGDQLWRDSRIVMHIKDCSSQEIRIPLAVGDDTSRTWVLTFNDDAMTLKHIHLHEDGTEDAVSNYGGTSDNVIVDEGTVYIEFPADAYSKANFLENGLDASVENTWVIGINDDTGAFSYRLQRPGRTFQVEFDLNKPLPNYGEGE